MTHQRSSTRAGTEQTLNSPDANRIADDESSALATEIDAVVGQVKQAIATVQGDSAPGNRTVTITAAELTLNAVVTKDAGGNLKFRLFGLDLGAGVELSKADTQTIVVTLKPVEAGEVAFAVVGEDVAGKLVSALRAIRGSVERAAADQPRFDVSEASVELNFQIDKDGTIDFIVAGGATTTNVQTVKLMLGPAGA